MEIDISDWITLYNEYNNDRYSPESGDRKFVAFTGVAPQVCEYIFTKYVDPLYMPSRFRLLLVLHFLKTGCTENLGCSRFGISRPTYRSYLWETIDYLDLYMDEIKFSNRFEALPRPDSICSDVTLIVDATECAIDRPA